MFKIQVLKRVLIPAATLVAESKLSQDKRDPCICRPSELPIYHPDVPRCEQPPISETEEGPPQALENAISTAREGITKVLTEIEAYKRVSQNYIDEGRNNAEWLLKYLREEDNKTPKAGAIAIGGLTGFILGLRGGFFRRTLFASLGALGMASVCYPKEAADYSQIGITEAKKYLKIAYNFAYGVKKDDPPMELPTLPKFPSSLSEAWDTVSKSATSLVSDQKATDDDDEQVTVAQTQDAVEVEIDPLAVVSEAHGHASQSCHCPVGACLGQHDESLSPPAEPAPSK